MEDLFRFFLIRPPSEIEDETVLKLESESELVRDLREAAASDSPAAAVRAVARRKADAGYSDRVSALAHGAEVDRLEALLREKAEPGAWTAQHVLEAAAEVFATPAAEVVAATSFAEDRAAAQDAVLVIKIDAREHGKDLAGLTKVLRWMDVLERSVTAPASLAEPGSVAHLAAAPVQLPGGIFPIREPRPATRPPVAPEETEPGKELADQLGRLNQLTAARDELMRLEPTALNVDELGQELEAPPPESPAVFSFFRAARPSMGSALSFQKRPELFALRAESLGELSDGTRSVLEDLRIDARVTELARSVALIEEEAASVRGKIAALEPAGRRKNIARIGSRWFYKPMDRYPWDISRPQPLPAPAALAVPDTHGSVEPVGVTDLLIVRQELKCYEAREIAHIENVLQGESKSRSHRRATTTEELVVTEIESEVEEEREHETTDRFEMQRETAETIATDASLEAGLRVSGSYGMAVEFESHVNGTMAQSRERSTRRASEYARDVTSRSASRVTERFKRIESRRIVREVEEENTHELDNRGGSGHVSGIYQWVEKRYEAQIWNYGLRTVYDFTVPEPAAFLIAALSRNLAEGSLEKPTDFTLKPNQITENNYHFWVREYEATGVVPPPELHVTVSKTSRAGPDDGGSPTRGTHSDAAELVIPDGYEAGWGFVVFSGTHWDSNAYVDAIIGQRMRRFGTVNMGWGTTLDSERESIPVGFASWRMASVTLAFEVTCRRTERALEKWQNKTHSALLEAYQRKLQAYEEKLAALEAQIGVEITGRHPSASRELERDELRKACISILTDQHFTLFDAIEAGSGGLPQLDLDETGPEGGYIRFFEQAFEWQNLTYTLYPYFWGRKSEWVERLHFEDTDPLFQAFLKAGAARVVLPVRPGFEAAIDHFMNTGEIWNGGELPDVTSELYVPIVQEIREQTGAPGDEVPQGEPWDVVLPTTLVYLRASPSLPKWEKNEAGEWVEVATEGGNTGVLVGGGGNGHDHGGHDHGGHDRP